MNLVRRQGIHTLLLLTRPRSNLGSVASIALARLTADCSSTALGPLADQRWRTTRGFASANSVQSLLDSMQAVKLRDSLEVLSDTKPFLTYKEFTDFIMQQGAADTVVEADKRADVLVEAGLVLRFNGIVYLKPREVSELVYRTLPTNPEHARRNLAQVEHELDQMDLQHKQIRKNAKRLPRFFLWTGFVVLTFQLVAFTYLTWWELSWDVMEPYGYILSLAYSCLAYLYFLLTRGGSLEFGPFEEYWTQQQAEKKMTEKGFDVEKYQHLMRTRERYKRYLASQAEAMPLSGDVLPKHKLA